MASPGRHPLDSTLWMAPPGWHLLDGTSWTAPPGGHPLDSIPWTEPPGRHLLDGIPWMAPPRWHPLDGIPWTEPPGCCALSLRRRCVRSGGLPRLQVSGLDHSRPSLWVKALIVGRRESLAEAPSHRLGSGCTSRPNRLRPRCGSLRPVSPAVPVPELLLVLAPRGPGEGCRRGDHGPEHLPCAPREGRSPHRAPRSPRWVLDQQRHV